MRWTLKNQKRLLLSMKKEKKKKKCKDVF